MEDEIVCIRSSLRGNGPTTLPANGAASDGDPSERWVRHQLMVLGEAGQPLSTLPASLTTARQAVSCTARRHQETLNL